MANCSSWNFACLILDHLTYSQYFLQSLDNIDFSSWPIKPDS